MKLTEKEKADRYDYLQTAIKWTIEQYVKQVKENVDYADNNSSSVFALIKVGEAMAFRKAVEDMEKWV